MRLAAVYRLLTSTPLTSLQMNPRDLDQEGTTRSSGSPGSVRRYLGWALFGAFGIGVAVGIALVAGQLASQPVGITGEPVSATSSLAPPPPAARPGPTREGQVPGRVESQTVDPTGPSSSSGSSYTTPEPSYSPADTAPVGSDGWASSDDGSRGSEGEESGSDDSFETPESGDSGYEEDD